MAEVPSVSPDSSRDQVSFVPCGYEVPILMYVMGQTRLPRAGVGEPGRAAGLQN